MSVFRAFSVEEFLEWPAWRRLLRVLKRANGGSYGLSGARGAGKSWLMMRAIEWVRDADDTGPLGGIGLWYPSPSEYDPMAFLASLSDSFATEIDRRFRRSARVQGRRVRDSLLALAGTVVIGCGVGLVVGTVTSVGIAGAVSIAIGAGAVAGIATYLGLNRMPGALRREVQLAGEAKIVRERARFNATRRETAEIGAEAGRGITARARTARERELVERPATLSSLVNDFRALAAEAGEVAGRVVIAIDELDKMTDPDKVRALLRDIKGIFEVPHVHFLVSVSDEAARTLSIGALTGRNEFSSSFYTVIEAPPATPDQLANLLERRSDAQLSREVSLVLAVLAGGNPREALRLADLASAATTGADAATSAISDEALTLRREIVTAEISGTARIGSEARVGAFTNLPDHAFARPDRLAALGKVALSAELWQAQWQDPGFKQRFGEEWQRLMVRIAVAQQLIDSQSLVRDPDLATRLRDVMVAASQSADVARIVLQEHLRLDTRAPSLGESEARTRLRELAQRYDEVRSSEPPSGVRTRKMTAVLSEVGSIARQAGIAADELQKMIESDAAGERVVGLAVVETTGDPSPLEAVLAKATQPLSPFEGYHAMRGLETMWPSLSAAQRHRVASALTTEWREGLANDPPRVRLAARLEDLISREASRP
jgi:hypothetical protein